MLVQPNHDSEGSALDAEETAGFFEFSWFSCVASSCLYDVARVDEDDVVVVVCVDDGETGGCQYD